MVGSSRRDVLGAACRVRVALQMPTRRCTASRTRPKRGKDPTVISDAAELVRPSGGGAPSRGSSEGRSVSELRRSTFLCLAKICWSWQALIAIVWGDSQQTQRNRGGTGRTLRLTP